MVFTIYERLSFTCLQLFNMKYTLVLVGIIFMSLTIKAQIKAVTGTGDEVILNPDGTWQYVNDSLITSKPIETNPTKFLKAPDASFLVKSNKIPCGIYINPKKWNFSKQDGNQAKEFMFTLKDNDAYAMLITEKMEIPLETLKGAALTNAKKAAPGIKITSEEYRNVNGLKVLCMQMEGVVQGMNFTYLGYYFSNAGGTVQLIAYTTSDLMKEYKKAIEELLNGFAVLENKTP